MFSYAQAKFDYEPYPICLIEGVLPDTDYRALAASYPPIEIFEHMPKLGDKYSLSERNNPKGYRDFIARHPQWGRVHDYIKSEGFVHDVMSLLKEHNVDLGFGKFAVRRASGKVRASLSSRLMQRSELSARFEFSIMGGQGGHIRPHTDEQKKVVTLVVSMTSPGEWDNAWGGGTQVCMPKDRTLLYNQINRYLEFDQVDVLKNFPFNPNQCILFIKTYNSWHQVTPIAAPPGAPLRKTLTINIEQLN